ncbi:MAG TPA: bacteriohemerythrin [Rhodospirillaceae bacterium]|nr:bacteriohemerythrin [Rhodospirillaceae bacterium]
MEMTAHALDAISVPAFVINQQHQLLAWNRACELLTGVKAADVLGTDRHWSAFYPQPRPCLADLVLDKATDQLAVHYALHGKAEFAFDAFKAEGWFEQLNGKRRYLVFEARPLITQGLVVGALEMLQDITPYKEANDHLRLAASVFDNTLEGIMITDIRNRLVSVNKAFHAITGYGDEVVGENPKILASERQSPEFYQEMWRILKDCGNWQGEIWNRRKNGEEYLVRMHISVVMDGDHIANYVAIFSDITKHKEAEERINFMAHHDFLTGLPNRILLEDRMSQTMARAKRDQEGFAVAFLDLDKFKMVNDALGHDIGDKLLQEVAIRLQASVRGTDTVSRQGGDEFVILLTGMQGAMDVAQVAKKLIRSLREPYELGGHRLSVTTSIGLSLYPSDGDTASELIKNADTAMYHAKDIGRNNFQFYTQQMNAEAVHSLMIESGLKAAIPSQLYIEFQPQLCVATQSTLGAEALVRWQHPSLGMISPAKFIPLAEDSGLIKDIGDWVLEQSCALIRRTGMKVAVNVSPLQLSEADLVDKVQSAMEGIDPSLLTLEITESAFIKDFKNSKQILERLKALGFILALDDFGTGYSSLSYLNRLPFDYLKIDQSFIRDENSRSIVLAIISLAEALGLMTVAEGVETPEQMAFLERNGCSVIQGYFFARPMRETQLLGFLEDHPPAPLPQAPKIKRDPMLLSWSFTFATGNKEIDSQHRRFIEFINALHQHRDNPAALADIIAELRVYARHHFAYEEKLMAGLDGKITRDHRREHKKFLRKLETLDAPNQDNLETMPGQPYANIARDWLVSHILTLDKDLVRALKKPTATSVVAVG